MPKWKEIPLADMWKALQGLQGFPLLQYTECVKRIRDRLAKQGQYALV